MRCLHDYTITYIIKYNYNRTKYNTLFVCSIEICVAGKAPIYFRREFYYKKFAYSCITKCFSYRNFQPDFFDIESAVYLYSYNCLSQRLTYYVSDKFIHSSRDLIAENKLIKMPFHIGYKGSYEFYPTDYYERRYGNKVYIIDNMLNKLNKPKFDVKKFEKSRYYKGLMNSVLYSSESKFPYLIRKAVRAYIANQQKHKK